MDENYIYKNKTEVSNDELSGFFRQQPNRYLINLNALNIELFPYYAWLYNAVDTAKMNRIRIARDRRYDAINQKRMEKFEVENAVRLKKGKPPLKKKPKLKDKTTLTWRENWIESGEPPAILDSGLLETTSIQLKKFLLTKGYFLTKVTDSVKVKRKSRFAEVFYKIDGGLPYQIRNITYAVEDQNLNYFIYEDTVNCLVKRGMRYDAEVLSAERDRIVRQQKDNGYYKFGPEFIYILVDTNLEVNWVDVRINIKRYAFRPEDHPDTLIYSNHVRYTINNIYVVTDYDIFNAHQNYADTSTANPNEVRFLYNKKLLFRQKDIVNKILFYKDQTFNYDLVDETYTRLSSLKAFKSVSVTFKVSPDIPDHLDCYILMSPLIKQSMSIESEGTNTSGNLGMAASVVYQNRNTFKGSELLEVKIKGGLIAQKNFNTSQSATDLTSPFLKSFNTVQFGPEVNLNIPKPLFPFSLIKFFPNAQPKTIFSSSLNFQQNSLYVRTLSNISYGMNFNGKTYQKHAIIPIEINYIQANLSGFFGQQLLNSSNFFLRNSFASHVTTVCRYSYSYNNQNREVEQPYKTLLYFKTNIESSGNLLRGIYNLAGAKKDSLGRYDLFNVPFAQFVRADMDFRAYKGVRKLGRFVFRAYGGMGYALNNYTVLPYEKSFFAGGPNSIRAWKARTVGPGSFNQAKDSLNFDKIGDIQIEMNFEFRFNIYKILNGAYFVDAGNIWLRSPNPTRPGGDFAFNRFYKEFATGTGVGLRADFSFFILRIDGAFQVYNPSNPLNERWMFGRGFLSSFVTNFGIGYPF